MIPTIDLNSKKVVDLSTKTPMFPYEKGTYKLKVHKVYLHDSTKKDDGTFNPYGSLSYRARVTVLTSNNPNILSGKEYLLMFGVFEKGFKGEKAASKLRNLLAAVAKDETINANEFLKDVLDAELDDAHVLFDRNSRTSELKQPDGSAKKVTFTDVDTFQAA